MPWGGLHDFFFILVKLVLHTALNAVVNFSQAIFFCMLEDVSLSIIVDRNFPPSKVRINRSKVTVCSPVRLNLDAPFSFSPIVKFFETTECSLITVVKCQNFTVLSIFTPLVCIKLHFKITIVIEDRPQKHFKLGLKKPS